MEQYFSTDMAGRRFLRNVLLFSLAGLIPVLAIYVLLTPGFASALAEGGPPLRRFLRQVLTNGLPVVFVVNYVGFFLFALSRQRQAKDRDPAAYIAADFVARFILFFALHALIYVVSADWFGSFGGSRLTALQVVAPTLARSALFENISGVYLYATLVSAIPLYVSAIKLSPRFEPVVRLFPGSLGPIAIALLIFAAGAVCLTILAGAFIRLQS
ncbi:hypothetical protein [Marivita geojedonensis]|uniref:Uncharacterized protein n=1 Tax=Marivita geojedonensis TaxID=1123756 RepID=A0A1X4NKA5_9RHOB|nr:hypothetical protein [Marivita geojedonensis]OSQ50695.1 hypothetical protein MGEO_11970 [Marivita geojedonensis]PRY76682.1 hypothetical protein CLV76_1103 [Marivita geojedonensis]